MTPQKWVIFIVAVLVVLVMLSMADAILAGVLYVVVLLFEHQSVALTVFKWVFRGLLFIEIPIILPLLYYSAKKGGDNSGT